MIHFHEKSKKAKKATFCSLRMCLLHFLFLRQGRFHCEIRALALSLVRAEILNCFKKIAFEEIPLESKATIMVDNVGTAPLPHNNVE